MSVHDNRFSFYSNDRFVCVTWVNSYSITNIHSYGVLIHKRMCNVRVFFFSNDVFTCVTRLIPRRPSHHPICSVAGVSIVEILYYSVIENFYGIPYIWTFQNPCNVFTLWLNLLLHVCSISRRANCHLIRMRHAFLLQSVHHIMRMYTQNRYALLWVCRIWEWMHTRNAETLIIIILHDVIILHNMILCTLIMRVYQTHVFVVGTSWT